MFIRNGCFNPGESKFFLVLLTVTFIFTSSIPYLSNNGITYGAVMTIYNTTGNSSYAQGHVTIDVSMPLNVTEIQKAILQKNNSQTPENLSISPPSRTGIPTN